MESYKITKLRFIKTFQQKNISLFTIYDVKKIFQIRSVNTLKHLLKRLKKEGIIKNLLRGKYIFLQTQRQVSDFEIANFLVTPSYISLESALSFYGIIEQFPYQITSLAIRKSKKITINNKVFNYSKITKEYFKDFVRKDNFLIAIREKAIFDYFYFIYKGQRSKNKIEEFKSNLDKSTKKYIILNAEGKFLNFLKRYVEL